MPHSPLTPPPPPNRELQRGLLIVSATLSAMLLAAYAATLHWKHGYLFDYALVAGRDWLNFWMVGRAAWQAEPGPWYDLMDYSRRLQAFLGADYPLQQWSYPPTLLLVAAPFGLLSYFCAWLVWAAIQIGLMAVLWRRQAMQAALLLASPAMLMALASGQLSLIWLCLLIAVFAWLETRPRMTGLLIGCFGIKPQLVLLMPVALLAQGRWRTIVAAGMTVLGGAALVVLFYGPEPWIAYLRRGLPAQAFVAVHPPLNIATVMPTLFVELHALDLPERWCDGLQLLAAAGAAWLLWRGFRGPGTGNAATDAAARFALFAATAVLAAPYWMGYDLLILTWAAIRLLSLPPTSPLRWSGPRLGLCALAYFLPVLCLLLHRFRLPGVPLVPLALAWWMHDLLNSPAAPPPPSETPL